MNAARVGFVLAMGAGALWGTSGPLNVALFRTGLDPWSVAVLRPVVGALMLLPLLLLPSVRREGSPGARARGKARDDGVGGPGPRTRRDRIPLPLVAAAVGGVPLGAFQLVYALSTEAIGVAGTVALLYLSPALILALQGPLFGDRPSMAQVGMAIVSVAGVWMVVLGGGDGIPRPDGSGLLWGGLTGLSFTGYVLFGRWMAPRMGSVPALTWSTLGAAGLLGGIALATRTPALPGSPLAWWLLVILAAATIPAASLLFFASLTRVDPGRASVGATVEPLVGTILATTLLGQALGGMGWVGLALLVAGVAGTSLLTTGEAGSPPPHLRPPDSAA